MLRLLPRFRLPLPPPNSEATPSDVAGLDPWDSEAVEMFEEPGTAPLPILEPRLSRLLGSVEALILPSTLGARTGESLATLLPLPDRPLPSSRSRLIAVEVEVEELKKPFPTLKPRFRPIPGLLGFPADAPTSKSAPNSFVSSAIAPGVDGVDVAAELDLDIPTLPPAEALIGFVDDDVFEEFEPPNNPLQPLPNPNTDDRLLGGESAVVGRREAEFPPAL